MTEPTDRPHFAIWISPGDKHKARIPVCVSCHTPFPCEASKGATT